MMRRKFLSYLQLAVLALIISMGQYAAFEHSLSPRFALPIVSVPVGNKVVNFLRIESALARIDYVDEHHFQWNSLAASHLGKAVSAIPTSADEKYIDDVKNLIRKSFMGVRGEILANVAVDFFYYKKAEIALINGNAKAVESAMALQQQREMLQELYMGQGLAGLLWGEENQLAKRVILASENYDD